MSRKLPPLNALRVFDEVARHDCLKNAAAALCVTQSAVSKQIQSLETNLGAELLKRHSKGTRLTNQGEQFYKDIVKALDIIEAAADPFIKADKNKELIVSVPPSLSGGWLASKVQGFHQIRPDIVLRICTQDAPIDSDSNVADVSIVCARSDEATSPLSEHLFDEELLLISSPEMSDVAKVNEPKHIVEFPLIDVYEREHLWQSFFNVNGLEYSPSLSLYRVPHFYMALSAVKNKLGIGLVPNYLCCYAVEEGGIKLLSNTTHKSGYAYFVKTTLHKRGVRKIADFVNWLKGELST